MAKLKFAFLSGLIVLLASATVFADSSLDNFQKDNTYQNQFTDVSPEDWFYENVKAVYEYGIMTGDTETAFNAEGNLSIAEALAIYCRLHSTYHDADYDFKASTPWYQTYIDYAAETGVTYIADGSIDGVINRADFATLLSIALPQEALPEINTIEDLSIPDVSPTSYYYDSVYMLYRAGILSGSDSYGTFEPSSGITRSAVAAIISRMADPSLRMQVYLFEAPFNPVPVNQLANLSSLKRNLSDSQFQQAYDAAVEIVKPFAQYSREDQIICIASALRQIFESGMAYSMSSDNYNNVYGYFIEGSASCAGCTRATGLCLNILGIPYEHVNENQYTHQWCRVNVNGVYWICDAYGLCAEPEPAPYTHPYF